MRRALLTTFVLFSGVVAANLEAAPEGCPDGGGRVFLLANGNVTLNGKPVGAGDFARRLSELKPRPSEICYSRENPTREPPPEMRTIVDAIIAMQLPVSFYTDSSFSKRVSLK